MWRHYNDDTAKRDSTGEWQIHTSASEIVYLNDYVPAIQSWCDFTAMMILQNMISSRKRYNSQFGMGIVIRSGIIYYKWTNLKRESLDASILWFWANRQGTGDWDVMTPMCVTVMPMLQNAISQTPESYLGVNNLRSRIIYHKQLNVVFIQLFGNRWFIINSMFLKWFARQFEHIVKCITLLSILRVW